MNISIVEFAETKMIGMKFAGPFDALSVEMPKLWEAFLSRVAEIPHVAAGEATYYGVADEDFTYKIYTEYIAVQVDRFETIPHGMLGFTLPAATYLKATHQGPMEGVQNTYMQLFKWINENGYEQDLSTFRFEKYDKAREENEYEIFIPIKSR